MRRYCLSLIMATLVIFLAGSSHAALMKGTWEAQASLLQGAVANSIFDSDDTLSWSVIYDNEADFYTKYYDNPPAFSAITTISDTGVAYIYMSDAIYSFDPNITNFLNLNNPVNDQRYSYQSGYSTYTYLDYYLYGAYLDFGGSSGHFNIINADGSTDKVYLKNVTFTEAPSSVPVPSTIILLGTGIAGLVGSRLRRKKK